MVIFYRSLYRSDPLESSRLCRIFGLQVQLLDSFRLHLTHQVECSLWQRGEFLLHRFEEIVVFVPVSLVVPDLYHVVGQYLHHSAHFVIVTCYGMGPKHSGGNIQISDVDLGFGFEIRFGEKEGKSLRRLTIYFWRPLWNFRSTHFPPWHWQLAGQ